MANSSCESIETKFAVTIREFHEFKTGEHRFELRGKEWIFRVNKTANGDMITVDLERIFGPDNDRTSCMATATIELHSNDRKLEKFIGRIQPKEFSALHSKWSLNPFITWDDIRDPQKKYIEDEKVYMKVTVRADRCYEDGENLKVKSLVIADENCDLKMRFTFEEIGHVLGAVCI